HGGRGRLDAYRRWYTALDTGHGLDRAGRAGRRAGPAPSPRGAGRPRRRRGRDRLSEAIHGGRRPPRAPPRRRRRDLARLTWGKTEIEGAHPWLGALGVVPRLPGAEGRFRQRLRRQRLR